MIIRNEGKPLITEYSQWFLLNTITKFNFGFRFSLVTKKKGVKFRTGYTSCTQLGIEPAQGERDYG